MSESFSVIILAGGFGRRLGRDKATTEAGGRPLLHWSALAAAQVSDDIVVARRPDQQFPPLSGVDWREIVDHRHDRGPLAGLEAALPLIEHDLALAVACDMPFLQPELLRAVAAACEGVAVAMPRIDGVAQPLLAAYRPAIVPQATSLLDEGRRPTSGAAPARRAPHPRYRGTSDSRSRTTVVHKCQPARGSARSRTGPHIAKPSRTRLARFEQNRPNPNKSEQDRTAEGTIRCRCSDES